MGWKLNEFGLLVPDTPYTNGPPVGLNRLRKVLGSKYLFDKPRREMLPGGAKPPAFLPIDALDMRNVEPHIRGRCEESVRVLVGVAVLRSKGLLPRDGTVSYSGARYQRGSGNENYDAAHQFPCTPSVNSFPVPHFAPAGRLRDALALPLGVTTYVPKLFNYADRLFESSGGCDAVVEPIRMIMHDQKEGQPVHVTLVQHAAWYDLLPDYIKAYRMAHQLATADTAGVDLLDPAALDRMFEAALSTPGGVDTTKPTAHMEMVGDVLWFSLKIAEGNIRPAASLPQEINRYAEDLLNLAKHV